jgi:hypothetical protein
MIALLQSQRSGSAGNQQTSGWRTPKHRAKHCSPPRTYSFVQIDFITIAASAALAASKFEGQRPEDDHGSRGASPKHGSPITDFPHLLQSSHAEISDLPAY